MNWSAGSKAPRNCYDAREYDAVVASGENVTAGLMALTPAGNGRSGAQLAGLAGADQHHRPAFGGAVRGSIPRDNIDQKFAEGFKVGAWSRAFRASARTAASPRWAGAVRTPPRWPLPPPLAPNAATSIPMWTGSTRPTRRITSKARKLDKIAFEEMLELASLGAKVLQTRSVELAMRYKVRLRVCPSFEDTDETMRHSGLR